MLCILTYRNYIFLILRSRVLQTHKLSFPSVENGELSNFFPLNSEASQNIAMQASPGISSFLIVFLTSPVHSTSFTQNPLSIFFLTPGVADICSRVGPKIEILCHRARRQERLTQVPALSALEI